jgi:transposase
VSLDTGDLDLTASAQHSWVSCAQAVRTKGRSGGLTTLKREELDSLRNEVRYLRAERDVLRKAAVFFAKDNGCILVTWLCLMRVSRRGYYAWHGRPDSAHVLEDRRMRVKVGASFESFVEQPLEPRYIDYVRA